MPEEMNLKIELVLNISTDVNGVISVELIKSNVTQNANVCGIAKNWEISLALNLNPINSRQSMAENKTDNHLVVFDYAGFSLDIPRFTCYNPECNCATIARQPWMTTKIWNQKIDEFKKNHPFDKALSWSEYCQIQ